MSSKMSLFLSWILERSRTVQMQGGNEADSSLQYQWVTNAASAPFSNALQGGAMKTRKCVYSSIML